MHYWCTYLMHYWCTAYCGYLVVKYCTLHSPTLYSTLILGPLLCNCVLIGTLRAVDRYLEPLTHLQVIKHGCFFEDPIEEVLLPE
jgi:hypothetical protein